ncbi:MAG TPA: hypothetical protein PKY42_11255, partial [Mesotoga sp.]|nr:hypothetical protein [Mesotoga sp.]
SKSDGSDSTASSFFERMPAAGNEGWNVPANAMPVRNNRNAENIDPLEMLPEREERVQNMQPPDMQPPQGMPVDAGGMVEGRANMQPPSEMPDFDMGNRARGEAEQIPEKSDDLTRSETITIYASMLALGLSITILKLKRKI